MKVLICASEAAPLIKFGGLGDVIGSLPKALEALSVNADVIIPYYSYVDITKLNIKIYKSIEISVPYKNHTYIVGVYNTKLPNSNVDAILLRSPEFFSGDPTLTEVEVYTFFSKAVVEYIKSKFNTYDLVHCNDWHTGLVTHLLEDELSDVRPATLFTIHNLMYQGIGGLDIIQDIGITPGRHKLVDWDIQDGDINLILQGIASSDYINTVSLNYAQEILTTEFGKDLVDILVARSGRVTGILNGIDYSQFPRNYDVSSWQKVKKESKLKLQNHLGITASNKPIYSFISRMDPNQKGVDILYDVVPEIVKLGGQFVLLASGDKVWEDKFIKLQQKFPQDVSISIKFDLNLALDIYKSSNFFLIPSKYEPCGLTQMISMWYGTLPIARGVGGLKDSIQDGLTGFLFQEYSAEALFAAIKRSYMVFFDEIAYKQMVQKAMLEDFSWDRSARDYKALYEKVLILRKESVTLS